MDILMTNLLMKVFLISVVFSFFEVAFVQKIKDTLLLKKRKHVILFNFISCFLFGTVFSMWFFNVSFFDGLWVSLFSFIEAPSIYESLKKQNLINYTPKSLSKIISGFNKS